MDRDATIRIVMDWTPLFGHIATVFFAGGGHELLPKPEGWLAAPSGGTHRAPRICRGGWPGIGAVTISTLPPPPLARGHGRTRTRARTGRRARGGTKASASRQDQASPPGIGNRGGSA